MSKLLLLSSTRLLINKPSIFEEAFGKPLKGTKMGYVINATKAVTDRDYFERNKKFFQEQGVEYTELDLDNLDEVELRKLLPIFDFVYVEGGNTFYLLKSIRTSGFDKVIKDLIPKGLIYIGGSAGSYVACPTIEMSTWVNPEKHDRFGITDFKAMNLVPFLVLAHYVPEYESLIKDKVAQAKYSVKILTDEQAILIKDDKITLI